LKLWNILTMKKIKTIYLIDDGFVLTLKALEGLVQNKYE